MITALEIVLLAILAYAWVGYPIALGVVARMRKARPARPAARPAALPGSVSFLFSAYNEEEHLAGRIANLQRAAEELRSLGVRCEILAGVDGSDDRTLEIARSMAAGHPQLRVFESAERRGKMRMVKDLVAAASGEVLVLTDANTCFRPGGTAGLIRHFADPGVGGVCGRLVLKETGDRGQETGDRGQGAGGRKPEPGARSQEAGTRKPEPGSSPSAIHPPPAPLHHSSPEASYWDWETRLKVLESALDSCLGANGAIYAIRRELFWRDVPDNTVVDDFVIGMKVREAGGRLVYEPEAVAEEQLPELAHEWRRRVRIGAGDFQAIALCRRCLLPRYGFFAWMFWSHKILRWLTPHIALLTVVSCGWRLAARSGVWGPESGIRSPGGGSSDILTICVLTAFAGGFVGWLLGRAVRHAAVSKRGLVSLLLLWEHFVTMQAALFAGSLRYLRGDLKGHWTRTPRGGV